MGYKQMHSVCAPVPDNTSVYTDRWKDVQSDPFASQRSDTIFLIAAIFMAIFIGKIGLEMHLISNIINIINIR